MSFLIHPADMSFPDDAIQCGECGGWGCRCCGNRGWLSAGDRRGARCARLGCGKFLKPDHIAIYCCNECAAADA